MDPPKKTETDTEGNTLKDCELQLKARRAKYEHLNLFSKYDTKLHIQALYNGYRRGPRNLQPRDYGLRINFTLEDLNDEYHLSLVKYAIAKHNREVEDNAKLAFEELIFVDTCNSLFYLEYHFFFVALNLSKDELGGYYAEVYATYPDEDIHVESFCSFRNGEVDGSWSHKNKMKEQLRLAKKIKIFGSGSSSDESGSSSDESSMEMKSNSNEDGSEYLCEEGKQSNESSIGILSDSVSLGVAEPTEQD